MTWILLRSGAVIGHVRPRPLATTVASLLLAVLCSTSGLAQWGGHWPFPKQPIEPAPIEPVPLEPGIVERLLAAYETGRYADFDRLAGPLASQVINPFEFEAEAEPWIEAAADRRRAAFVAAAVALELANTPLRPNGPEVVRERLAIDARFVLAELGCAWLREHPPSAAERSWHTAFVALARATNREGYVIPVASWQARMVRLTGLHEKDMRSLVESNEREHREDETHRRQVHRALLMQLRRDAARVSGSTRTDVPPPAAVDVSEWRFEHGRHLLARFPDDPHPTFLEATVLEYLRGAMFEETLLDGGFRPVWLDAADVEPIARGGRGQVRAVPRTRRMDRPSAERLLRVLPQEAGGAQSNVSAFQAVPPRAPVAAETALRLGQNYVRLARPDLALPAFARAEALATTPYEQYLARLFAGAAFARAGRRTDAITAFQGALQAVPRAQAASFALATLLLELDAWDEAAGILEAAVTPPLPDDPLDYYYWSDPTAASRALAQLREEARR